MKARLIEIARQPSDPNEKLNLAREYLQAFALRSLHESEALGALSFVGGTALRFLYGLPRFSEDMDFSLENRQKYEPARWLEKLKRDLTLAGFEATIRWNDRKTVGTGWIRVAGVLHELGLAAMPSQNLAIKIEIDTRPPAGAASESRVVNRHFIIALRHHDLPSLMGGKLHALCTRKYPKGRDWYDLLWYRAVRPPVEPNLTLLQSALDQTEGDNSWPAETWRECLLEKLQELDLPALQADVTPFLERPEESRFLTVEHLTSIING